MDTNIPTVIVVTGPPGSGKTTLTHKLSKELGCPAICRDEIKVGYVLTRNKSHEELGDDVNANVSDIFFEVVNTYLKYGVTIIIEAAFQHKVWAPRLQGIKNMASLKLVICNVDSLLAFERRQRRLLENPNRTRFHGEKMMETSIDPASLQSYDPPSLDFPTLHVDTTNGYEPDFEEILKFVMNDNGQ